MTQLKFTLEENRCYWHRSAFLHYLHQLEPQVEEALGQLCGFYKTLFGEHEGFDRQAFIWPPDFNDFYSDSFTLESWRESEEPNFSHRASDYLARNNSLLKSCLEYQRLRWTEVKDNVQKALEDPKRRQNRQEFIADGNILTESVLTGAVYRRAIQNDEHLRLAIEHETSVIECLVEFRKKFFTDLIEKFHLEAEWLCLSSFLAIREGKTKLEMPQNYTMHVYPLQLLREVYGGEDEERRLCYFPTGLPYPNELPRPPTFQFDQSFGVYSNSSDYESLAVAAYREHIQEYVKDMQNLLRSHGYKLKRRNANVSRIKWLVRWTVQGWTMPQILDEYTQTDDGAGTVDDSTVWKAFKSFRRYDLPVRRKKIERASGTI